MRIGRKKKRGHGWGKNRKNESLRGELRLKGKRLKKALGVLRLKNRGAADKDRGAEKRLRKREAREKQRARTEEKSEVGGVFRVEKDERERVKTTKRNKRKRKRKTEGLV